MDELQTRDIKPGGMQGRTPVSSTDQFRVYTG